LLWPCALLLSRTRRTPRPCKAHRSRWPPFLHRAATTPFSRCRLISVSSNAKAYPSSFQYRVASLILPLCAGVLPRPPTTTAPPLLTEMRPCAGGIHLLCRRFILVRLHHVRHVRRVRCTSVSCVMKTFSCSGRGEPLLAVPCHRHARSDVLEHVLAALQRRVSWAGPLASGPGRSVHTYCASQGKEDASALWRWPHAGFGPVAKGVRKSLFYFQ
jgi:hypothetical protein